MIIKRTSLAIIIYITCVIATSDIVYSASQKDTAVVTLDKYLQMRLDNANWEEYSKLITWPDEPSWDCKWVDDGYKIGAEKKKQDVVIIKVTHNRIGLYCYDYTFKVGRKAVTIDYELAFQNNQWKVKGPMIDYPDISANTLLKELRASLADTKTDARRNEQLSAVLNKIKSAMNLRNN